MIKTRFIRLMGASKKYIGYNVLWQWLALLRGILHYGEQACNHYIAFRLLALIRSRVFGALRKLCPAKLEGRDRGNLIHHQ